MEKDIVDTDTNIDSNNSIKIINVEYISGKYLIWNAEDAYTMIMQLQIMGSLGESRNEEVKAEKRRNISLPLILRQEEALLCYLNGYIKITKPDFKNRVIQLGVNTDNSLIPPKDWLHYLPLFRTLEGVEIIPAKDQFTPLYLVIADLYKLGYYMTSGSYFGCELLVYDGNPSKRHAKYLAVINAPNKKLSPTETISIGRIAVNVKKSVLVCNIADDNSIKYFILNWDSYLSSYN